MKTLSDRNIKISKSPSRIGLLTFVVIFAAIGGYLLIKSFAASSPPTVYTTQPSGKYLAKNSTFTVQIREDSGTTPVNVTIANLTYPVGLLKLNSIDFTGSAFPTALQKDGTNGKISIVSGVPAQTGVPTQPVTGDQLVATLSFTTLTADGSDNVAFTSGTDLVSSSTGQYVGVPLSSTQGFPVKIDTSAPSVSLAAPAQTTPPVTINGTYILSATATDGPSGSGISSVNFQLGGTATKTFAAVAQANNSYTYSLDTKTLQNGNYTVLVEATDAAGNKASTTTVSFAVNNTTAAVPSAPTLNAPTKNGNSVSLSWTAPTNNGGAAVTGYKVYKGTASNSESLLITLDNLTSFTDSTVTAGNTYFYKVSAINSVGEGAQSVEQSIVISDSVPPTVSINLPTGTVSGIVTLAANATDNTGGSGIASVEFYLDQVSPSTLIGIANTPNGTSYSVSWNTAGLSGTHTIIAKAIDKASNSAVASGSITISSVDRTPPVVNVEHPTSSSVSGPVLISGSASDASGISKIVISITGPNGYTLSPQPTFPGPTFSYTWDSTKVPNGNYSLYVMATDNSNITTSNQLLLFVTNSGADTTPPSSVSSGLTATNIETNSISLTWPASTDNVGVTGYYVYYTAPTYQQHAVVTGTTFTDTNLTPNSTYCYRILAFDAAGNTSVGGMIDCVTTRNVSDTTAPTPPSSLVAVALSPTQVNLTWNASTDNTGVVSYDIYKNGGYMTTINAASATQNGVVSFGDTNVSANTTYKYTVYAKDAAGNKSGVSNEASVTTPGNSTGLGSINGVITGFSGAPLPGAKAKYASADGILHVSTANTSGFYTLAKIIPGTIDMRYTLADYITAKYNVNIVANQTVVQNAILVKSGVLSGTVKSSKTNAGLPNTKIQYTSNGVTRTITTDDYGYYSADVPAGNYVFTYSHLNHISQNINITIGEDQTVVKNVTLVKGF